MYEHTNSVLTAQPHWATMGSQKGALGASRAAWRAAIGATLVSFEAPAERAQPRVAQTEVRACCMDMWDFRSSLISSPALATGQTGRPPAHQGT